MAGEGGRAYEQALYTKMNRAGVVPEGFTPAGSASNAPDMVFLANHGQPYPLELKNDSSLLDFGQSVIEYSGSSWRLSGTNTVMVELLRGLGVETIANEKWGVPHKRTRQSVTVDQAIEDVQNFGDEYFSVDVDNVISYYNNKTWRGRGTFYIQIQGRGLYYMGSNPANIPGIPELSGTYKVRLRRKPGGTSTKNHALPGHEHLYPIGYTVPGTDAGIPFNKNTGLPGAYNFTTAFQAETLPGASNIDLDNILDWL